MLAGNNNNNNKSEYFLEKYSLERTRYPKYIIYIININADICNIIVT